MFNSYDLRKDALPSEMQTLLRSYPRDSWDSHPGFREKTQQWLNAHQGFRRLAQILRTDAEAFLDARSDPYDFADRLAFFGGRLTGNLHGHHSWEDRSYFPELRAADPRFDDGLDILEKDHAELDRVLDDFTRQANRVIKLVQLDEQAAREETGQLHGTTAAIGRFLDRHLTDEEDLAVPIILHHRLRG